ncbi:hypothetical protein GW896_00685 [Candidatus Kuenenbacteria bacterium]|nr:hypothetical protein [Candidatus Kuenenbacteria bacterium]OIP76837.1 MAG: hypothetical protein AUK09_00940 [Parcubacteria group bacterium CG2_30_36_38]PJC00865.1 MAG: hypothetical protein CO074_00330 [bacterium (Candidatus Moisslbacteria) CG_4_9_14_0_8_um_filter_36_20]
MFLTIIEIILWLILISSSGIIIFVLISKFSLVANLDLEKIPKEKTIKTKKQILQKRLYKTINEQIFSLKNKLIALKNKLKKRQ